MAVAARHGRDALHPVADGEAAPRLGADLDALAAAYAAAGRFPQAVTTARAALALLPSRQSELAVSIQQRLDLYTDRRPYRRPR